MPKGAVMKEIMMDRRLSAIADYVKDGAVVADIGCDHGYLAAYLIINGIAKHVYASDINPKPLAKAEKLVEEYNLSRHITTILSDGLESIPHNADTIVIAGMGGELIADLLDAADWVASPRRRFILQPMTFPERLRKYLAAKGFEIISETPIIEEKHTYCVINAFYSGVRRNLTEFESIVGKIDTSTTEGAIYAKRLNQKYRHILEGIQKSNHQNNIEEIQQLLADFEKCLER